MPQRKLSPSAGEKYCQNHGLPKVLELQHE